ncbi:MAG: hypothetical protein V5A64_05255 [Candidatus Thermoplasmatota archaeon]
MSIKKEMLSRLTEEQLKSIAEDKGIKFNDLSSSQEKYYKGWDEKDKMVDVMTSKEDVTVREIEKFLKMQNNK